MSKNRNKLIIENILIAVIAVVNVVLTSGIIKDCYNPFVFNDEIGYWTHAATLAGYDWTGISDGLSWYSFGYSFLLVPLMKIFHDPVTLYRSALWLNVAMNLAVYFMYIKITRYLFPKLEKIPAVIVAGAASLYTSYQFNVGITLSETALLFVVTLITFVLISVMEKPTYLNLGILGLLCAYSFMVHNRCIGIVASVCLAVAAGVYFKKIPLKKAIVFFAVLVLGFAANTIIKHYLVTSIWTSGQALGNDTGSVVDKIRRGLSGIGPLKSMISVFVSQFFAAAVATFGLAWFALWRICLQTAGDVRDAFKRRKSEKNKTNGRTFVFLFIFCAFISTWMISAIFMYDYSRIDHLVYTRYYDIVIGLLIICGLAFMSEENKSDNIYILIMPLLLWAGANRVKALNNNIVSPIFNKVCAPGICWFFEKIKTDWYGYAVVASAVFAAMMLIMKMKKKKSGLIISSVLLAVIFSLSVSYARVAIYLNQEHYAGDRELLEYTESIHDGEVKVDGRMGTFISFFQFMMPDKVISRMTPEDASDENVYFFANPSERVLFSDYEYAYESDNHILYRNRKVDNTDYELPLSCLKIFDTDLYVAESDDIISNPASNYVCYGPYCIFPEGSYEFDFDMDFDSTYPENIGFIEVKSTSMNEVYDHIEITGDMINNDGSCSAKLSAELESDVSDIELIVFLYDPSEISMILDSIIINTEE